MNRIDEAAIFANHLKEARAHIFAEDGIEQSQRVTAIVVPGTGAKSEGELGLFELLGDQAHVGVLLLAVGRSVPRSLAPGKIPAKPFDGAQYARVGDVAGDGDE